MSKAIWHLKLVVLHDALLELYIIVNIRATMWTLLVAPFPAIPAQIQGASFNSSNKLQLCVFSDSDSDDPDDPPPPKPSKSSEMPLLLEEYFWEKDS